MKSVCRWAVLVNITTVVITIIAITVVLGMKQPIAAGNVVVLPVIGVGVLGSACSWVILSRPKGGETVLIWNLALTSCLIISMAIFILLQWAMLAIRL